MIVNFYARDYNSSRTVQEQVLLEAESTEAIKAKWRAFRSKIPFSRFFTDNTVDSESASDEFVHAVEEAEFIFRNS